MKSDMIKVFRTTQLFEAKVIEALLRDNDIDVFVMNKQDSSYGMLLPGSIEIYIPSQFENAAKEIINEGLASLN